jgi:elongation factor P
MKASDIRRGHIVVIDGQPCRVMDFQHRTPGNLRAFVQLRLRNLITGNTFDQRVSATEFVDDARLDLRQCQVLFRDESGVHVMDTQTYEQFILDAEATGEYGPWLEPEMNFQVELLDGRALGVQLPAVGEYVIVETAPVMKTATKTASSKPAKLSNGVTVQVPEFLSEGDKIRVDPRIGQYLERAK